WRAIVAEDFTVSNVRRAVAGIARYVVGKNASGPRIIVGRDPRFMGERFVDVAAEVLSAFGVKPLVIADAAPTPAISYEVIRTKADGAITFTASHNPPQYTGIKFSTPDGAPALPEVTEQIEKEILAPDGRAEVTAASSERLDPKPAYLGRLSEIIDLDTIQRAGLRVCFDPLC